MLVTLNEYTLALLCGGVSCLTYVILHLNDINENKLIKKKRKPRSDSDMSDDSIPLSEIYRRRSTLAARFRANRAESIKNDHVMFADEIQADDLKFEPNPDINGTEVSNQFHL